uniref:Testis expressed 264, ER-phagy receptor a n=1 Tax=Esox lucius TaxID=8010 RepID=A0AAY5L5W2_ESOLU
MPDYIILSLIGFLILCLIVTVVVAIVYSGLLTEVNIKTGSPPIRNVTIVYKLHKGTSKDCGAAFTEAVSIGPKLKTIRVSYNDLTEERQLHAWPYIEINTGQLTHYMAPLSSQSDHRHTGFIVPELITPTAAKTPVTEESSDLTGEMDTSGAEPQSDVITKPSVQAQSEDTEMSQAQPSACFTSTLLPHRDQGDGNDQEQAEEHTEPSNKEHGDRGSSESVDSGSSFEELELVEEQERELGTGGSEDEGHSQWGGGAKDDPGEYLAGEREQKCDSEE